MCSFCETMRETTKEQEPKINTPKGLGDQFGELFDTILSKAGELFDGFDVVYIVTRRNGKLVTVKSNRVRNPLESHETTHQRLIDGTPELSPGDYVRLLATVADKVVYYRTYTVDSSPLKLVPCDPKELPEA